jgi:hypothetical protein
VGVLCTCGLEVGELFDESGCDWGFKGGDICTVFGRFEVAPGAKRDLLVDFIVYVGINERMRVRVASEKQREKYRFSHFYGLIAFLSKNNLI